jgi:hypothetical protein
MKNWHLLYPILFIAGLACNALSTQPPADQAQNVETIVAATMAALTQASSVGTTETLPVPPSGTAVSLRNVSFMIPLGLATDANSEVVAAVIDDGNAPPWDVAPEHLRFTLNAYPAGNSVGLNATIMVFPAQEYAESNPGAGLSMPQLQAVLADPSMPLNVETIPGVPYFNAGQVLTAQAAIVNFQNGSGIRSLSHYTQGISPIIRDGQVFQYHGLTADGRYYVIAVLPVLSPLQSTGDNPSADGVPFPDFATADPSELEAYYQAMTGKLNGSPADSFQPPLGQLDTLIQSLSIATP